MLADPTTLVEVRERRAREFNPPSALLAGEEAEYRRPVRWTTYAKGLLHVAALLALITVTVFGLSLLAPA